VVIKIQVLEKRKLSEAFMKYKMELCYSATNVKKKIELKTYKHKYNCVTVIFNCIITVLKRCSNIIIGTENTTYVILRTTKNVKWYNLGLE
jgi:hypothetical protein